MPNASNPPSAPSLTTKVDPSLLHLLLPLSGSTHSHGLAVEPPERAGHCATESLMAHALQGKPMGRALFADLGTALAGLHSVPVPPSGESMSPQPLIQRLQTEWAAWLNEDGAAVALPPLESPAQEAMRHRFLSRHGGGALQTSARQVMAALQSCASSSSGSLGSVEVVSHGALALDQVQALPEGRQRFVCVDSPVASALPGWWDVGCVLAWLPLLAHVQYSAVHYEPIVLTAYLKALPAITVEPQYVFVRHALQVAGLTMAALVLSPNRLPWLKDVYLKETFLKQAVTLIESPSQVDWLVQLPQ